MSKNPVSASPVTRRQALASFGGVGLAALVASCSNDSSSPGTGTAKGPSDIGGEISFWSWSPHAQDLVAAFTKAHPKVKVDFVNTGAGSAHYQKLQTAFAAGHGAPDVAMVEYAALPQYVLPKQLIALDDLGGAEVKGDFVDSVIAQCMINGKLYGVPLDSAPMAFGYRTDLFKEYGLTEPKTWDDVTAGAKRLHAKHPDVYYINSMIDDGSIYSAMWQAGGTPFTVDGSTLKINMTAEPVKRTVGFWVDLVQQGLASTFPAFSPDWNQAMAKGTVISAAMAAWSPVLLEPAAKATSGKWHVSALPYWDQPASAEWGGSSYAVTAQSKNPDAAALFAIWVNHDPRAAALQYKLNQSFPVLKSKLASPDVVNEPSEFFGGQPITKVFAEAVPTVSRDWQWDPFNSFATTATTEHLTAAEKGKVSVDAALSALQDDLVSYAKKQGFTVA